eukprot:TRINITY_DN1620_c0_g1_i2.p1 TRINITY_DN1620_c0_g1~~TRINITY_DN1620_c0_g1_i2.p1  ORF type:complete len:100 (-),score=9.19 TRINITY_DN1620_c0_g1_i2:138-437(-)
MCIRDRLRRYSTLNMGSACATCWKAIGNGLYYFFYYLFYGLYLIIYWTLYVIICPLGYLWHAVKERCRNCCKRCRESLDPSQSATHVPVEEGDWSCSAV